MASLNEVILKSKIAAKSYLVAPNPNFAFRNLNICSSDSRLRLFYKGGKKKGNYILSIKKLSFTQWTVFSSFKRNCEATQAYWDRVLCNQINIQFVIMVLWSKGQVTYFLEYLLGLVSYLQIKIIQNKLILALFFISMTYHILMRYF